jgi:hypothetical protein
MLDTTIAAIRALLRADPSLTPQDRSRILSLIRSNGKGAADAPAKTREPQILRRSQVAARLGCTTRAVDNFARMGILTRVILPGRTRAAGFRESDVLALIGGVE